MTRSGQTEVRFIASPLTRIVEHGERLFVIAQDGSAQEVAGDSAELLKAILSHLDRPRTRDEIAAHIESLSGAPLERPEVIDEALALLDAAGAMVHALADRPAPPSRGRLLLGVSGAVAASGAPELVARLQRAGFEVRVAMTRDARRFVSPLVLEALTHQAVARSLWQHGMAAPHIQLAEWAQLVLICPASATTISRIAGGDCSTWSRPSPSARARRSPWCRR